MVRSLLFLFTFLSLGSFSAHGKTEKWTYCYDRQENKVYFVPFSKAAKTSKESKDHCSSQTFFVAPQEFHMVVEEFDNNNNPSGRAGSEQIFNTNDGRQLLVSQWNDLSKSNQVWILEPNFTTNQVNRLCTIENFGDAFSTSIDKKTGQVIVLVRQPKSPTSQEFIRRWVACQ